MTGEQRRLYAAMLRLFVTYGKGGAVWRRTRATEGTPADDATVTQTGRVRIRFMPNNRVAPANALPQVLIYTAPWWGLAEMGADIRANDVYDNGVIAFLILGAPDSSQGFLVPPAKPTELP